MKDMEQMANESMMNAFKLLSAIFDQNNGVITVSLDVLDKAQVRFFVDADYCNGSVTFTKINGQSREYLLAKRKIN